MQDYFPDIWLKQMKDPESMSNNPMIENQSDKLVVALPGNVKSGARVLSLRAMYLRLVRTREYYLKVCAWLLLVAKHYKIIPKMYLSSKDSPKFRLRGPVPRSNRAQDSLRG